MSYQQLGDLAIVQLGGINKNTGKPNPKEVEGYLVRIEERDNKFRPGEKQNLYILNTKTGQVGIFGKTDIDRKMKTAQLGAMTKFAATNETKDTGKGFPMKVWYVAQDPTNVEAGYGSTESYSDESDEGSMNDYTHPASAVSNSDRVKSLLKSRTTANLKS